VLSQNLKNWLPRFEQEVIRAGLDRDPAHDLGHIRRVVNLALKFARVEGADPAVVLPAAYLHDIVNVPKNDPRRKQASRLAAAAAIEFLTREGYPSEHFPKIQAAIESHSYSAGIQTTSIEGECVQDADRIDALGAIGIVRCFSVGTDIERRFYDLVDPFAKNRELNDMKFTLDHFYVKLFRVTETLKTRSGRLEGYRRVEFMQEYMKHFQREIALDMEFP
jgi:uncharacterized protein